MADWDDLVGELDRWRDAGRMATFWWRDDDTGPDDEALAPFLDQRRCLGVPLALATIPATLAPPTVRRVLADPGTTVLQHGWRHHNNAPDGVKRTELVDCVNILDDLARGRNALQAAFDTRFHHVMVPPWNRIGSSTTSRLTGLGFIGLSTHGPRKAANDQGLHIANVHIDIMDWRTRAFIGDDRALDQAVAHLTARRQGDIDGLEPTGLMTHHRVHDLEATAFLDRFVALIRDHDTAHWLGSARLFGAGPKAA